MIASTAIVAGGPRAAECVCGFGDGDGDGGAHRHAGREVVDGRMDQRHGHDDQGGTTSSAGPSSTIELHHEQVPSHAAAPKSIIERQATIKRRR